MYSTPMVPAFKKLYIYLILQAGITTVVLLYTALALRWLCVSVTTIQCNLSSVFTEYKNWGLVCDLYIEAFIELQ